MGTVILNNRYRVLRELGQGGFGKSFLAVDTHLPSRQHCVIKQLYPIISKPKQYQWVKERFQREAAILESLSRGNSQIPQLYAYFAEGETFYLVQEYIEGVTLTQKVEQEGRLPEHEVANILKSLLQILDYIHQHQIIHRDVKPDNIILRASDQKPVLIDFGVVKEALGTAMDSAHSYSMAIGTPGYMPSEQAAGRPVFSSDLYSLGVTGVFLLSGQSPHSIQSDPNSGELLWRKVVPHLSSQLAAVIDGAIRFHPRDRFANAKQMLVALNAITYPNQQQTQQNVARQSQVSERATVAAVVSGETDNEEEAASNQGNPILQGLFIVTLLVISAGALGFGVIQVLDSLRQGREAVVKEQETEQSKQETATRNNQQTQTDAKSEQTQTAAQSEQNQVTTENKPKQNATQSEQKLTTANRKPTQTATNSQQNNNVEKVPVFSPGAKQQEVINTLGQPTSKSKGYWKNTRSFLYKDYGPNQVDLGYLFDQDTNKLRQTEMSFDSSVALSVIEQKLQQILQGKMDSGIRNALAAVYRKKTDLRSFSAGSWSGMIQRKPGGRLYIGVWEDNLHRN